MNGRAAKRIRRAAWAVVYSERKTGNMSAHYHQAVKRLRREYLALPYHKRNLSDMGIRVLTHEEQDLRWRYCRR